MNTESQENMTVTVELRNSNGELVERFHGVNSDTMVTTMQNGIVCASFVDVRGKHVAIAGFNLIAKEV